MNGSPSGLPISVLLTSVPLEFAPAVHAIAALRFTHVDIVGLAERPMEHAAALAETDLLVGCAAVGTGLAQNHALDAVRLDDRRAALEAVERQIADAARLGATCCYLVPGLDNSTAALLRFADACQALAEFAGRRMVRLCVEHCPGRALPTAAQTLIWLAEINHDNLSLLLDVGHCLLSQEVPAQAIERAGSRLGYVHLDDNDGSGDLHWPLLTGRLTPAMLKAALSALGRVQYVGPLTLEFNSQHPDPLAALRQGKELVEDYLRDL